MDLFSGMISDCSAKRSDEYFEVNNYGVFRALERDIVTHRPHGRPDYHLIYVKGGRVICEGGEKRSVGVGGLILYRPDAEQHYCYTAGETGEYIWFHFSGAGCETLLAGLFQDRTVVQVGVAHEIDEAVRDLRANVIGTDPLSKEYACGRLLVMFAELKRRNVHRDTAMERVIAALGKETFQEGNNRTYAAIADMSESHFLRRFTAYTGTTPHKYKTRLLLSRAAELLRDTNMHVGEVADAVGIEDGLYFSRIFKREYGMSPLAYKKGR